MMRTRVKFCGITRIDDALEAAVLGVDAIGLIFAEASKRRVTADLAATIAWSLPPFVTRVGLFLNHDVEAVCHVLDRVPLDVLQFHGEEPPDFCRAFGKPYLKAVPMTPEVDLGRVMHDYADASALLLDTHVDGAAGGTGRTFDWDRVPHGLGLALVLAGGLDPDNVADAVRRVRPYAVDVASGIERAPGIKDSGRMKRFIEAVRRGGGES